MTADAAVAAAVIPGEMMDQLTEETKHKEPKSGHQAIKKAPQVNHVSICRVQLNYCNPTGISKNVVNVAPILSSIPPTKLVYHERTVVEDTKAAGFACVCFGTQ